MGMRDRESTSRQERAYGATVVDWFWLGVVALVMLPLAGVLAALFVLDVTQSFTVHVAAAAVLPAAVTTLVARRFGAPPDLVLRLALVSALSALVLLDLGWSGLPV
jgi:hypothetical protein